MKLAGMAGTGSGKVGSMVYATVAGQQIVRQYQPVVANPSTSGQVENRAKLKLASQLASSVSKDIAIKRDGLKSSRNQFISQNYGKLAYNDGQASINLNGVQLTKSNTGMPGFSADRSSGTAIAVALNANAAAALDKVVYVAYTKESDGSLQALGNVVVSEAGVDGLFAGELPITDKATVIYAYGVKALSDKAAAAFGNMQVITSEKVAKLICNMSDIQSNLGVTKTAGLTLDEGSDTADSEDDDSFNVRAHAGGGGSVSGGGRFAFGDTVTLTATPNEGYRLKGFYADSDGLQLLSSNNPYTFTATGAVDIFALFEMLPSDLALENVQLASQAWDHNTTNELPAPKVQATVTGTTTGKVVAIVKAANTAGAPQVGRASLIHGETKTVSELGTGFNMPALTDRDYAWLVVGTADGQGHITPQLVHPYYYNYFIEG